MNFQKIPKLNNSEFYLDVAFRNARKEVKNLKLKTSSDVSRERKREIKKIQVISEKLCSFLDDALNNFPYYEEMDDFYQELLVCYIDVDRYRQDLSKLKFASKKIRQFEKKFSGMIKSKNEDELIKKLSKEYFGRVSSIMKQIDDSLSRLDGFRLKIKKLPDIKPNLVNVVLFGFPNVGKSTLLSKMTTSKPKIASYAFTTKDINVGYIKVRQSKIQVLDTPGTLNRFENMNDIEKIAYLTLKHLADLVIYVFDPTFSYSLEDQIKLFEIIKKKHNYVSVLSKQDLVSPEVVERFSKQFGCINTKEMLKVLEELVIDKEKEILKIKN